MSRMKLMTIVGTRPEIIRLSEIIKLADKTFTHILVHTGQNYDYRLNDIFFQQLGIREPNFFLNSVGSSLGETIGNIIAKSFDILSKEKPDALLVLGDTNSVLCTIAAKRLKIPIFHMEAGNRCFDQNVPEEINRKISDHISDINLTYTEHSRRYLIAEGYKNDHIFVTGSPLYEVIVRNRDSFSNSGILNTLSLERKKYFIVSIHREENIDLGNNFEELLASLNQIAEEYKIPLIFSVHPRTRKKLNNLSIKLHKLIMLSEPFGFFEYLKLQKEALCVLSDSGTISEESAMLGFTAISLRTSTERPEAVDYGTVVLGGIKRAEILNALSIAINTECSGADIPPHYLVENVSTRVIRIIQSYTPIVNQVIWRKQKQ
ncbi:non-hydrolyzing UDP-N-acetylglucosamine 2-epimerase [Jiulongibacter sediminis]|uniref:UDP-N-acetylglucosamine 2-epimerase n=1 Tax=Jiulongibacter sediminis TaxID=1605367 RepID=A0A0P7BMT0_9BACT|nr:UDP-N-acetylglucosamine 2-epimerase (non-hydrolyzing) [Jiulongibacter sediminis]KPM48553.1 UDP-N-acetylglucosamine 2-epimerase [Jiulongibacter sediminis]TBX25091.1 UDP-N-acetylglucosamine 2-epimerase [Jiulongibacter sediminis]